MGAEFAATKLPVDVVLLALKSDLYLPWLPLHVNGAPH
jgi:hypothetical protein